MKDIIIRFGAENLEDVSWMRTDDASSLQSGSLAEAAADCQEARVIVLVPAADVLLIRAMIPGRNRKRSIQAAPFVLEEHLADNIEKFHFSCGPRNPDGSMDVAVVNKKCMVQWLSLLHNVGLEVDALIPETLAVPYEEEGLTILIDHDQALIRTGLRAGFAVDVHNLQAALQAHLASLADASIGRIRLFQEEDIDLNLELAVPVSPAVKTTAMAAFGQGFDRKIALDLLQGEYSRKTDWQQVMEHWRIPFVLALVFITVKVVLFGVDFIYYQQQSQSLQKRIESVYLSAFPETRKLVNPRAQMEQQLSLLTDGQGVQSGFLESLARVGPALQQTEGYALQRLSYRDNDLELELTLAGLDAARELKDRLLANTDLSVEIRTSPADDNRVSARLQVKEKR
ncbi:MAG: type II secretion system protein GspL [Desulfoarculaceae bacterium]|nr:type II secretion system protein GspL [Desulfoarculaceae bacterium]